MIAPIMLALGARQIENKAAKAEYDRDGFAMVGQDGKYPVRER